MRTVTYGAACSLDGFITAADGGLDWLHWSDDARAVMEAYWPTIDTVVMGRKTWEVAAASGEGGGGMGGVRSIIFSRTLQAAPTGAELVGTDAVEFMRDLKRQEGKGICVLGGGELAAPLLAAGIIDEVGLNIHPVLLGSGTPMFRDPGQRIRLSLLEGRVMDGGCLLANYRVTAAP